MVNSFKFLRAALLCSLLIASPGEAGGPVPTVAPLPVQVAAIEHGPQGTRPVIFQVSNRRLQWAGDWTQDAAVAHPSWSPDGAVLLFRQGDTLMRHGMGEQGSAELAEGLAMPRATRPDYAISPDGQQVSLRRSNHHVELISMGTGMSGAAGAPRQVAMPSGCLPSSMQWRRDGKQLYVLCVQEDSKQVPLLVKIDPATGGMDARPAPGVAGLLRWSEQHGLLMSEKADAHGQRPGRVTEDGSYHPLRPVPAVSEDTQESPPIDFVQGYLPAIDSFVMARATENPGDPVLLTLVTPGSASARRWLKAFSRVGTLSYGSPEPWVAFVDRKPADRGDVGDIYIVRAGKEDARLIARSNPKRGTFYSSPAPRPHKTTATNALGKPNPAKKPAK